MGLSRTVDPAALAVALADVKKQVEIATGDTAHDDHLTRLIKAATTDVERHTRRALINQTWRLSLREFPQRIYLPRPPLQSVTSVTYVDDQGVTRTLDASKYQVTADAKPAFLEPAYGEVWPATRPESLEAVKVVFVAGYGADHTSLPESLRNLIYELVAFRFAVRGEIDKAIPKHVMWALDANRCGAHGDYYGVKA